MVSSLALFLIELACFSVSPQTARRFLINLASVRFELRLRSADDSFGRIISLTQRHPQREQRHWKRVPTLRFLHRQCTSHRLFS